MRDQRRAGRFIILHTFFCLLTLGLENGMQKNALRNSTSWKTGKLRHSSLYNKIQPPVFPPGAYRGVEVFMGGIYGRLCVSVSSFSAFRFRAYI